jgi:hypothetical protein
MPTAGISGATEIFRKQYIQGVNLIANSAVKSMRERSDDKRIPGRVDRTEAKIQSDGKGASQED